MYRCLKVSYIHNHNAKEQCQFLGVDYNVPLCDLSPQCL